MTSSRRIWIWTATLAAGAVAVTIGLLTQPTIADFDGPLVSLPVFAALAALSERLRVRIRGGEEVDAVTLVEAVLAPLLFAFSGPVVVATVAAGQLISAGVRRGAVVKNAFNVAQW